MPYKNREKERAAWKRNREAHRKENAERARLYRLRNKEKLSKYHHEKYLRNLDKIKRYKMKNRPKTLEQRMIRLYGITEDDYQNLLKSQNNVCAICGKINDKQKRLEVDHDHVTGKVRALLCGRCNKVLGMVYEEPALLNRMANYLSYHKGDK